jgi:MFS family permease
MSSAGEPPSAPEAAAAPVEKTLSMWERLTPDERSFVRKHRITEVCSSLVFSTCMPHWNSSYMDLVKGDTALMARHYGASASIISCFEMFTSPFVASLSDTVGRKYLAAFGRIGWILFFGGYKIRDRSLPFRLWSEVVCWGIVQAGVWSIFAAQHSDIFGERPTLSSEIKAADEMWSSIAKTIGPFLSFACAKTVGSYFSEYLVSAFTAASMITLLSIPETLMDDRPVGNGAWVVKKDRKPAHRKKFRLATANPFANIALLFRNGPGLRSLATTSTIVFSINEIWSTQGTFRCGKATTLVFGGVFLRNNEPFAKTGSGQR